MKTAISIPDNIFKKAEKTAKKMGLTRSRFFTASVEEFIENHIPSHVTDKLNSIYTEENDETDRAVYAMQIRSIDNEDRQL